MKLTHESLKQDEDGKWWYYSPQGIRQTATVSRCTTCQDEYVALPGRTATHCSPECYRKSCKRCQKEFKPTGVRQLFCSEACKLGGNTCEQCGKTFTRTRKSLGKFCSKECFYEFQVPTGTTRVVDGGYVLIKVPKGTPGSKRNKKTQSRWMFAHRFVMQEHLGRALLKKERVHHKNGDRADNDLENLELTYCSGIKEKHVPGQRIDDLVNYLVTYHRDALEAALEEM